MHIKVKLQVKVMKEVVSRLYVCREGYCILLRAET